MIRSQLLKRINYEETFGYITKVNREKLKLPKEHYNDAIAITGVDIIGDILMKPLFKKCMAKGVYKMAEGKHGEKRINVGKVNGFLTNDKVKYKGKDYFVRKRILGNVIELGDINRIKVHILPRPKAINVIRITARKTWIMCY